MTPTEYLKLPALSIRAPWWWIILHSTKRHENRDWSSMNPARYFRGAFLIHASKTMTHQEYDDAKIFALLKEPGLNLPSFEWFKEHNGGIVGRGVVTDFVTHANSKWFIGPGALVFADNPEPVPFVPCKGSLGFFYPTPNAA